MLRSLSTDTINKIGQEVVLKGWVNARRDMGKIVFLDLRDRAGIVQVVGASRDLDEESQNSLKDVRPEWVLEVHGLVQERGAKQKNPDLSTGSVEVIMKKLIVLNQANTPPFEISQDTKGINEELRLKYRYLDLRSERMKRNLRLRHEIIKFIRQWLDQEGFVEINTPILTKSTPEGARDFLVPSRLHPGEFYALPQSPQQYKQLLMVAGVERYFQIAPCFRDEDARADRSPGEFYQLDLEMSFMTQEEIMILTERLFIDLLRTVLPDKQITRAPFFRLSHQEALDKYHSDKPDLRQDKNNPNELAFVWITDFPLFTPQTAEDYFHGAGEKWGPSHHMFTAPKEEDIPLLDADPGRARSYQHDLVLNGAEIAGGSVRIHDPKIQEKIFDLIGFSVEEKERFAHLLEAFTYGVPPHGGIAPGIDRLVRILAGEENIREVIAFPKSSDARDVMIGAPSRVPPELLAEVHVQLAREGEK